METETLTVAVAPGISITAVWTPAAEGAEPGWAFAYAPGAGSNLADPFGTYAAAALAERGIACLRFQFPYAEAGRRGPHRPAVLEATWRAVVEAVRPRAHRLAIGGRSMGGRIASQVCAQGAPAQALALLAYPLHPPGRPERTRDGHLSAIRVPTLFCSGTRDAFATVDELRKAVALVPHAILHVLADADHGFAVPRASGRARPDVWRECVTTLAEWLNALS